MLSELSYANGRPKSSGQIKSVPDDFCVEENLGFELTGEGEHLFLLIEKKLLNTEEMTKIIAQELSLPLKAISYAGMKGKFLASLSVSCVHCFVCWISEGNFAIVFNVLGLWLCARDVASRLLRRWSLCASPIS